MDAHLAADSQLQDDMLFQRDIVHALQDERRMELKNRLNSIEVGAGGISSAVGLQIAAGVALVGLLGTAVYFLTGEPAVDENTLPVGIIDLSATDNLYTYTIPAKPEAAAPTPSTETVQLTIPKAKKAEEVVTAAVSKANDTKLSGNSDVVELKNEAVDNGAAKRPDIQVQRPKVLSEFKDNDLGGGTQQVEPPVDALARNRQFSTQSIEVTAQLHDKYDFHYQFFDSKLFIYGDFKSKPYEILEINTEGSRAYYLFFENNYYGLKSNQQKLTRLRRISNEKLVKELEITRIQK